MVSPATLWLHDVTARSETSSLRRHAPGEVVFLPVSYTIARIDSREMKVREVSNLAEVTRSTP